MTVVARLSASGSLQISNELIEMWGAFDDAENVDDTYTLDDTYTFDDTEGMELLLAYLFDLTVSLADVDVLRVDANGNLLAPEFIENGAAIRVSSTSTLTITGTIEENASL